MKWRIGDVTITRIVELTSSSLGRHILPAATPEALAKIDWIKPYVTEDYRMVMSFHSLIVETADHLMIVDTCIGNDKSRTYPRWNHMQTSFLDDLTKAGFETGRFDTVLCTHMHVDHVGWNTYRMDDRWKPTFPNASYLYSEEEWHHWSREREDAAGPVIEDSVQPIFDMGMTELVKSNHVVCDEVSLIPTPGHTPGHVSVVIRSKGEAAVITGDIFHHPCQMAYPDWSVTADVDTQSALNTRLSFLKQFADTPVLCIGTHFTASTAGHIVRDGEVYRLAD